MMIERGDFTAVHEPFSYLAEFGHADLAGTRVTSAPALLDGLRRLAAGRPVFVKETTGKRYPEVLGDAQFMARDAVHTFLIRHPRETIASRYPLDPAADSDPGIDVERHPVLSRHLAHHLPFYAELHARRLTA